MSRNRDVSFGLTAILLHWTIAALFLGELVLGFWMTRVKDMALQFELIQWHKSFGLLVLVLAVLRILWRIVAGRPPALPTLSRLERASAATVQALLLAATILVPLAGWALVSASTLRIPTLLFGQVLIPHLPLIPSGHAEAFWSRGHALLAYGSAVLVLAHTAAALGHHFLLRDDVLRRILPLPTRDPLARVGDYGEQR
ncbi:cytochrome b [Pseudaminobacter sp. 19-2017]|uniref:Cytochrome b n=1 Tax=Pseudaminobacter soli (ex Zhang et al. 2022) TaxID=2831468 RepID=A0A942I2Q6_9HYPH|nr:cytochrome b [Pseudaminobacter soli]MBS3649098.1 cytochrome b [Pseudaminobacter soli]